LQNSINIISFKLFVHCEYYFVPAGKIAFAQCQYQVGDQGDSNGAGHEQSQPNQPRKPPPKTT